MRAEVLEVVIFLMLLLIRVFTLPQSKEERNGAQRFIKAITLRIFANFVSLR